MRGKRGLKRRPNCQRRITPAGAGKTYDLYVQMIRCKDHPRRCGENHVSTLQALHHQGSPPQVRGKLKKGVLSLGETRITPAGAGKTFTVFYMRILIQDHPRRCGENWALNQAVSGIGRITPAGAGKTNRSPCFGFWGLGSPPQVRGKH